MSSIFKIAYKNMFSKKGRSFMLILSVVLSAGLVYSVLNLTLFTKDIYINGFAKEYGSSNILLYKEDFSFFSENIDLDSDYDYMLETNNLVGYTEFDSKYVVKMQSHTINEFNEIYDSNYIEKLDSVPDKALIIEKKRLIKILKNEEAIGTIDIIWSKDSLKGQSIGNLSGQISDILPSRLRTIDSANKQFKDKHSFFSPKHRVEGFEFDLNLSFVQELLKRPGGKKAKQANASQKLVELKRMLAESIYKQKLIFEKRFWEEVMITAKWYLLCLFEKDKPENDCLYEGYSEKKNIAWMSFAGWIKHLSMTLNYLQFMEVIKKMENKRTYFPEMEKLKNYFSDDCGINTDEKAYAFILGILYGKVMQMQGAKRVNVSANALTWLKRLTLTGNDLPDLYVKIREKLLAYNAEGNEALRAVIKEIGILGNKLGDEINLKQTSCCYFLLLGQSLTVDILPGKEN